MVGDVHDHVRWSMLTDIDHLESESRSMISSQRFCQLLAPMLLLSSGCGGDDTTTPDANMAGGSPTAATADSASNDPLLPPAPSSTDPAPTTPPAPTMPPVPALPPVKCEPPAAVCEDFESGAINTAVWGVRNPNATLEVVQDRVAHGKYAMHTHTLASSGSSAQLVETAFLGANFWGRAYFYFEVKPRNIHAFLFEGLGNVQGNATEMSVSLSSYLYMGYMKDNPIMEYSSVAKRQSVPLGKWFCMEWNFRPTEGMNNSLWIDGVQIAGNNGTTFVVNPFTEARIGWTHYAHNDPDPFTDIWYDDIAFGPERIGCK